MSYKFRCEDDDYIAMFRRPSDNKVVLRITTSDVERDIPVAVEIKLSEESFNSLRHALHAVEIVSEWIGPQK